MRIHILAGCPALLGPEKLPAALLAELIGPQLRPATAFWLAPQLGEFYHDFLLDPVEDGRIEVFAMALRDNFGMRFEPLLVLAELMAAPEDADGPQPRDVLHALALHHPAAGLVLHALCLPGELDGGDGWVAAAEMNAACLQVRLDALRADLGAAKPDVIAAEVHEIRPEHPAFAALFRNAAAHQITARAEARLKAAGLAAEPPRFGQSASRALCAWSGAGIGLPRPLGTQDLDRLAERVIALLLAQPPAALPGNV